MVTIHHNPACGTSRNAPAMIRASGVEPEAIPRLEAPPSRETPEGLIAAMGIAPRDLLRRKGTPHDGLGLDDPGPSDAALIDATMAHPILIEQPVVVAPGGTRLCRPSEVVLEILGDPDIGPFREEDGEVVRP
jgi:arsenate reductase